MMRRLPATLVPCLALALAGCSNDKAPAGAPVSAADRAAARAPLKVRALTAEAYRAEMELAGPIVDFGTPDQHKYLRGGYDQALGPAGRDGETTYQTVGNNTALRWYDWLGAVRRLELRARAVGDKALVALSLDGTALPGQVVGPAWTVLRYPLPAPTERGRRQLTLRVDGGTAEASRIQLDWVWARRETTPPPSLQRVGVPSFSPPRRALLAPPPRVYSFYLHLPAEARFSFHCAAEKSTLFTVTVVSQGEVRSEMFHAKVGGSRWQRGTVDLSHWKGQAVRLELATGQSEGLAAWGEPELYRVGEVKAVPAVTSERTARNLVQIVVDSARWDMIRALQPNTTVRTPALNAFARRGTVFARAYADGNFTLPSAASYLSGRHHHSFMQNLQEKPAVPPTVPLLPEALQKKGFATAAFVANPYIQRQFGLHRGWDELTLHSGRKGNARRLYLAAGNWLRARHKDPKQRKERFYLYVHAMDPHMPYLFHKKSTPLYFAGEYHGKVGRSFRVNWKDEVKASDFGFDDTDRAYIRALYQGELTFHDGHLRHFLGLLGRLGLIKETMVLLHSDHGEELFDHGGLWHGSTMYEEQIHVPLLLYHPHLYPKKTTVRWPVSLVDLVPSVLEGLGLPPLSGAQGASLLPLAHGSPDPSMGYVTSASEDRAVVVGPYKLYVEPQRERLFDLDRDPGEKKDILALRPLLHRLCEVYLGEANAVPNRRRRLQGVTGVRVKGQKAVLDPATRKQLQGLGYVNGGD